MRNSPLKRESVNHSVEAIITKRQMLHICNSVGDAAGVVLLAECFLDHVGAPVYCCHFSVLFVKLRICASSTASLKHIT